MKTRDELEIKTSVPLTLLQRPETLLLELDEEAAAGIVAIFGIATVGIRSGAAAAIAARHPNERLAMLAAASITLLAGGARVKPSDAKKWSAEVFEQKFIEGVERTRVVLGKIEAWVELRLRAPAA